MLGCFNPILGQIWTNSNIGLKIEFKNVTQLLGFPTIELKQPNIFRVHAVLSIHQRILKKKFHKFSQKYTAV